MTPKEQLAYMRAWNRQVASDPLLALDPHKLRAISLQLYMLWASNRDEEFLERITVEQLRSCYRGRFRVPPHLLTPPKTKGTEDA